MPHAEGQGRTPLLDVRGLRTEFAGRSGRVQAVDGISFAIGAGEILGIVGESGSGKSVTGQSIMGLLPAAGRITAGEVRFDGRDLLALPPRAMRALQGAEIAMIFQEPMTTLNPVMRIDAQLLEVFEQHRPKMPRREARARVAQMLGRVGIGQPERRMASYPHEMSGGMQQRVIIAAALLLDPRLIIADEPTTALDVTIQAQIMDLLKDLQDGARRSSILLISHDLGLIGEISDRVCVMYAGTIVEEGPTARVIAAPAHPYTRGLLASRPSLGARSALLPIPGVMADLARLPIGCRFHPRCGRAVDACRVVEPVLAPLGRDPARRAACHLPEAGP